MLIDEFKRQYERPSDHDIRPSTSIARERERRRRGPRIPTWAPIALVVVVIVGVLYIVGSSTQSGPSSPSAHRPTHHHPAHHGTPVHTTTAAKPTSVKLELTPTSTVYVCLVNGSGAKLINERTFTTGEQIPTQTAAMLLLTLGNAGVQMKVNGKPVPVAPSSSAIRLELTPTAVKHIPLSQTPTCP
jgi:hypothetical protein